MRPLLLYACPEWNKSAQKYTVYARERNPFIDTYAQAPRLSSKNFWWSLYQKVRTHFQQNPD